MNFVDSYVMPQGWAWLKVVKLGKANLDHAFVFQNYKYELDLPFGPI